MNIKKNTLVAFLILASCSALAQTKAQITGCWTMPARAGEYLLLNADGSFTFNDYSNMSKEFRNYYGTWKKAGIKITLMYDDRPQQNFTIRKDKAGNWILRKEGGFLFVKGRLEECS